MTDGLKWSTWHTVGVPPVPKERVKIGKSGSYTPERTRAYEEEIGWYFRRWFAEPVQAFVALEVHFVTKNPRVDIDNLIKSFFDGGNGIAWRDDSQVAYIKAEKRKPVIGENERTVFRVALLDDPSVYAGDLR